MTRSRKPIPAGYQALVEQFGLRVMPLASISYVRQGGSMLVDSQPGQTITTYPGSYTPEPTIGGQIEFALKYDGVDLEVLRAVFEQVDAREFASWVRSRPTGKYTRRAWFLYEWLLDKTLDVPDAPVVAFVDALGADRYHAARGTPSRRHKVRDDLPGHRTFCPLVRRTPALEAFLGKRLEHRARELVGQHDPQLLHRAAQYLYLKETKSSFEIERDHPDRLRTLRFVELLRGANELRELSAERLVELQKAVLDPRYAQDGYRRDQNYVGQTLAGYREQIHYISPRPEDLDELMAGWLRCDARLRDSDIDPVVQAAALGFGFVFLHPFDDGNGRLHRYLIHHVLSRTGFTPHGLVLPVSAVMLADRLAYDACLETFSRPLLERLDYDLDARGALRVRSDSACWYRYFDATRIAEYLYGVVERTIETDLVDELAFLAQFDAAWRELREIVDMPDRRLERFLQICLANGGRLSARKREMFAELSDDEVARMEQAVRAAGLPRAP